MKTFATPALGILIALQAACAHVDRAGDSKSAARERTFVTGSHIAQRADPASRVPATMAPLAVYSRDQIDQTGRPFDLAEALRDLDPSVSR